MPGVGVGQAARRRGSAEAITSVSPRPETRKAVWTPAPAIRAPLARKESANAKEVQVFCSAKRRPCRDCGVLSHASSSQAVVDAGQAVAEDLLVHLREPLCLKGMRLEIDASIGIALHPVHGEDNETLQQRADIAMYSAKNSGRGHAIFEPELDRHSPRRLALAGGIRDRDQRGPGSRSPRAC